MLLEIKRSQKILVNNGYPNFLVNDEIRRFFQKESNAKREVKGKTHVLFYRNFMNSSYREDEKILKEIINSNVKTKEKDDVIKLVIYYKT